MPAQSSNDSLHNDSNIELSAKHNLFIKLYDTLLTNSAFQNGLKQISRFSQPLLGNNLVKLTNNVSRWVSNDNVYNQLANVWLKLHYPLDKPVQSFDSFAEDFRSTDNSPSRLDKEAALKNFYDFGVGSWAILQESSSLDTIKNNILEFAARAITKTYNFTDDSVATALFNVLKSLMEVRRELVSNDTYLGLVKTPLGDDFYNENEPRIKAVTTEYYTFAKRFILIDFPLSTNNKDVLKLIFNFIQDSTFYYGDFTLNFVERRLNFLLKALGQPQEENNDDQTITEKAQRVFKKVFTISSFPLKKIEAAVHQVQVTKTYAAIEDITAKIDKRFHIHTKIDETIFATKNGYHILKEKILEPSAHAVKIVTDLAKNQVTIVIEGLHDRKTLKKRFVELRANYEVLQKCAIDISNETVKLIFDKQALNEMEENGKRELNRLYYELRNLQAEKVIDIGVEYYTTIKKKASCTYKNAQKAIYYRKKEEGDVEAANAIRPSDDKEVDQYDDDAHPHLKAGRDATLAVAAENNGIIE